MQTSENGSVSARILICTTVESNTYNISTHSLFHHLIISYSFIHVMTRVANAAAITLQTWSRTVLAQNQVSRKREAQKKALLLEHDAFHPHASVEVVARRFLMVAACIALLGISTHTSIAADSGSSGGVSIMASSSGDAPPKVFTILAGALPSLLFRK